MFNDKLKIKIRRKIQEQIAWLLIEEEVQIWESIEKSLIKSEQASKYHYDISFQAKIFPRGNDADVSCKISYNVKYSEETAKETVTVHPEFNFPNSNNVKFKTSVDPLSDEKLEAGSKDGSELLS